MLDDFDRASADDFAAEPSGGESDIDSVASVDQDPELGAVPQYAEVVDEPISRETVQEDMAEPETAPVAVEPEPSLISRLFGRGRSRQRLQELNSAIDLHPDSPMNYVLRGELYQSFNEYLLAEADFRQALSLAQVDYETSRWGLVAQAVQDRARAGLKKVAGRV